MNWNRLFKTGISGVLQPLLQRPIIETDFKNCLIRVELRCDLTDLVVIEITFGQQHIDQGPAIQVVPLLEELLADQVCLDREFPVELRTRGERDGVAMSIADPEFGVELELFTLVRARRCPR